MLRLLRTSISKKLCQPQLCRTPQLGSLLCRFMSNNGSPKIIAERNAHVQQVHNMEFQDHYYWLREKTNQKVIDYIEAENDYCNEKMAHTKQLQETVYDEFISRLKQTDETVPYARGDFEYYSRTIEGKQYKQYCRKKRNTSTEEILLDLNEIAESEKLDYLSLEIYQISPDHKILAYGLDKKGDEINTVYFKNLETGEHFPDTISGVAHSLQFGDDNSIIFYTTMDHALRPFKVFRHKIVKAQLMEEKQEDQMVFHEPDERYFVSVQRFISDDYVCVDSHSKTTSEVWYMPTGASSAHDQFKVFATRRTDVEYHIFSHGSFFYLLTNYKAAKNFKLMRTPRDNPSFESAEDVLPYDHKRYIEDAMALKDHLVLTVREEGLPRIMIVEHPEGDREIHYTSFPDVTYSVNLENNHEFNSSIVRLCYSSFVTPESIFDYDMVSRKLILRKETPVLGGYDRTKYTTERIQATARDGTMIPISLVYKTPNKNAILEMNGNNPCLLYGYGAYSATYDAYFNSNLFSLIDRGFIMAIAHIRGGGEMGRYWYEEGKLFRKKNTFFDFIDCATHLIEKGYTSTEKLVISGASAGGLLISACINYRPDLFKAAILKVPFVDVINTMLDASIPLTVPEFEEWGNPAEKKEIFDYMYSYSPYDNIDTFPENWDKRYPSILVTSGLNDPRVQYWEPTKYVAKLRYFFNDPKKKHKGDNVLLLKTYMGAGHAGVSGRYARYREDAFIYAFILDQIVTSSQQ